jgi:uncharacterized protein YjbI with pentapeptide repeats
MDLISTPEELAEQSIDLSARLVGDKLSSQDAYHLIAEFVERVVASGQIALTTTDRRALGTMVDGWLALLHSVGDSLGQASWRPELELPSAEAQRLFAKQRRELVGQSVLRRISQPQFEDFLHGDDRTLERVLGVGFILPEADFRNRRVVDCRFEDCKFPRARFDAESYFAHTSFIDCDLTGTQGGDERGGLLAFNALFERVVFDNASMDLAHFNHAAFVESEFDENCSFTRCQFVDAKFIKFRSKGALMTECLFDTAAHYASDSYLDFSGSDLSQSSFRNANLTRAVFVDCSLVQCRFEGANLNMANFEGADVTDADFLRAKHLDHQTNLERATGVADARMSNRIRSILDKRVQKSADPAVTSRNES